VLDSSARPMLNFTRQYLRKSLLHFNPKTNFIFSLLKLQFFNIFTKPETDESSHNNSTDGCRLVEIARLNGKELVVALG
jgi:hypothetical protein